jgi:energy-coupling factor transporter ATP-binding protein EcfA2
LSGSNTTNGQEESKAISIGGDNPIHSRGADLLGRAKLANVIARHLRVIDASEGAVVGLLGPWGIGKTSLLNMIAESLGEKSPLLVVQFNPWLFSGTEQLAGHFFSEVAAQLKDQESTLSKAKDRIGAISGRLERYGQALSPLRIIPVAGPLLEKATDLAGIVSKLTQADQSINTQREELTKEMAKLESPVVVIIDDIDRLQPLEIRDIFRLVRLTANFPNLIYLLAFDRRRVESALGDDQPEGRAYLEKIIQLTFEVPPVRRVQLVRLLLDRIDKILNNEQDLGPFHEDRWPDLLHRVMVPLITNVRDVKRYIGSLPAMIKSVGDEIALEDVLVLEAVRVLMPDVHAQLPKTASALTTASSPIGGRDRNAEIHTRDIQAFVESGGDRSSVVRELCELVFPASLRHLGGMSYGQDWLSMWRRRRQVAHPDVLAFYIDQLLGESVAPARMVEGAFEALTDAEALKSLIADLDPDQLENILVRLEDYEQEFPPEAARQAVPIILDAYPRLRSETRGFFDFGPRLVVARLVLRLLRRIDSEEDRTAVIFEAFDGTQSLAGKNELITLAGHRENAGHQLVSAEAAERLEDKLREAVIAASPEELATERNVLYLIDYSYKDLAEQARQQAQIQDNLHNPIVAAALLRDALREARRQSVGSVRVEKEEGLAWDSLVRLYGGEDKVREVIDTLVRPELEKSQDDRLSRAVGLDGRCSSTSCRDSAR